MRTGGVPGVWRCLAGGRVLAVAVVAGVVTALVGASSGLASAAAVTHRPPRPAAHPAGGSGLSLAQAPPGLRAAVRRTPGLRAMRAGSNWSQQAELTASDGAANDSLGFSVAISGSTAVVGAYGKTSLTGAAYVFVRSGSTWSQQAKLTASDGFGSDQFGWSVAISGSTAMIGAPGRSVGAGAAYVFVRSGTTWTQQAELPDPGGISGDDFGNSVAIAGSTAVVGAPQSISTVGEAYVFVRSGTTWSQQAALTDPGATVNDQFGYSVAISGSTAVMGAPGGAGAGLAYVFTGSGGTWSQQAILGGSDVASGDDFGNSVAISGSTAVVGNPFSNANTGAAYVFTGSGGTWSQQAELTPPSGISGDNFGNSVAVAGSTAMVGAPNGNSAYVFTRAGTAWSQQAALADPGATAGDNFGRSVAIAGSTAVAGADGTNSATGAAYVFVAPPSPCGTLTKAPAYKHVIVIMDENHSYGDIIGSSQAPYINSLAAQCGLASEYLNLTHDSLPNYIGITSGLPYNSLLPFDSDCLPSSSCQVTTNNIFHQASSWKEYAESMPSNCDKLNAGTYAPRHNPSVYYTDLSNCATNDVPLGTTSSSPLLNDFSSEATAPAFAYVSGNLCDDMHGTTGCNSNVITPGDTWLSEWIPLITATKVYKAHDTVIFLVWDEGSHGTRGENCVANTTDQSCHVPAIVIAPSVKTATVVSTVFNHYSWLKTTEQLLGLPQIGQAKTAVSMKSPFHL